MRFTIYCSDHHHVSLLMEYCIFCRPALARGSGLIGTIYIYLKEELVHEFHPGGLTTYTYSIHTRAGHDPVQTRHEAYPNFALSVMGPNV